MDDASPVKWHLAHTTWFFETFVLGRFVDGYRTFDPRFGYCFNSYYEAEGPRHPRPERGLLTRPSCDEVRDYRAYVDDALADFFDRGGAESPEAAKLIEIGIHHEQQHQELILTDVLALFARNPLSPAYFEALLDATPNEAPQGPAWVAFEGGLCDIGADGAAFCWDNELPRHRAFAHPFRLCDRAVTNAEWLEFIQDGGYAKPTLWLSDGWSAVRREGWTGPAYFCFVDGVPMQTSLAGLREVDPQAPVAHVSFYEADAFARWAGKRLPTEFEWEAASPSNTGQVWEWTRSSYDPYPGYRPFDGEVVEYNGKFMSGQYVLRGGSIATPPGHVRNTYRNFFPPSARWQFSGLRLASDT
jgi:ergothioneine biosynthesis protein EgtB